MPNLKSFFYDKENNCDLHLNYSHLRIKKFCGHYREFLPNELVIFFSKMGFKVVQLSTRTYNDNSDRSIINILRRIKIFVYNKFQMNDYILLILQKKNIKSTAYSFGKEKYSKKFI
jgi:hypothetical protein